MKGFVADVEGRTEDNPDFRGVLYTGLHMQPVLTSLLPSEEIDDEVHEHMDEFLRVAEDSTRARGGGHDDGYDHGARSMTDEA